MIRFLVTAATTAVATSLTLVLAGTARADVGEIVLTQANAQRVLSISVAHVDNITTPIIAAVNETPGASTLTVANQTNESIEVSVDGRAAAVGPLQRLSLPETGSGLIVFAIPAGT